MDLNRPLRLRQAVRRPNRVGVADGRSHTATLRTCSLPSRASVAARYKMYICYIHYMTEPVVESMAEVRSHLADVIDRARRDEIPTVITRRGKEEAVLVDIDEYRRLRHLAEQSEDAWLNQLADEAEAEGTAGAVSLEEMAAQLRSSHA